MTKLYGSLEAGGTKFVCAVGDENFNVVEKTQFPTTTPIETIDKTIEFFSKFDNLAGLAIGLSLILVHLVCIRYTGTSVNPARSFGPALFAQLAGGPATALSNLWIFIVGPFAGAVLASCIWKVIGNNK